MDCTMPFRTFSFSISQHVDLRAQSCIAIELLCFKLFFFMPKFYSLYKYMLYGISTPKLSLKIFQH